MSNDGTDEQTYERRDVLSNVSGAMVGGVATSLVGTESGEDGPERLAAQLDGVTTERDRRQLEWLLSEMKSDAELLSDTDVTELEQSKQREFAAKGRLLRNLSGECGFEGFEPFSLGGCCREHDRCESINGGGFWNDSIFTFDSCDRDFYDCVSGGGPDTFPDRYYR